MIYCVWYPSGGFGHFINGVLSLYGKNFASPNNKTFKFNHNGNSHSVELVAPKYHHDPENYTFDFEDQRNYSVLIDNGITSNSKKFKTVFPESTTIKICYTDISWPIVARTMVEKAMRSSIDEQLPVDNDKWKSSAPWAVREKYFLFLKNHDLKYAWKPENDIFNLSVDSMLNYFQLREQLNKAGVELDNFSSVWDQWYNSNKKYISPVINAQSTIQDIKNNVNTDLAHIDDIWDQAVLYYFIWLEFGQEVPHNDYADFFVDSGSIKKWLSL